MTVHCFLLHVNCCRIRWTALIHNQHSPDISIGAVLKTHLAVLTTSMGSTAQWRCLEKWSYLILLIIFGVPFGLATALVVLLYCSDNYSELISCCWLKNTSGYPKSIPVPGRAFEYNNWMNLKVIRRSKRFCASGHVVLEVRGVKPGNEWGGEQGNH